eukprot:scaffold14885_cov65-Phaeocystis_antarctica.AAC.2
MKRCSRCGVSRTVFIVGLATQYTTRVERNDIYLICPRRTRTRRGLRMECVQTVSFQLPSFHLNSKSSYGMTSYARDDRRPA